MSSIAITWVVFACVFGGSLLGLFLRAVLPEAHLSPDSKDIVKLAIGLIATMSALVLGLLIASTKSSYDTRTSEFTQMSANIILLDRVLEEYGLEAKDARYQLRRSVSAALDRLGLSASPAPLNPAPTQFVVIYKKIRDLSPQSEDQRSLQGQALDIAIDLARTRWLLFEQTGSTIPVPFLVMLVFWLSVIFASFGLLAPRNATVIATLFVCGVSVSSAIFLILELNRSFEGLLQISSAPLRDALVHLGEAGALP
jgi:hypothetical protein